MESKFFEDIRIGDKERTGGRTITDADLANFAGISGDFNPIHVNEDYAAQTFFKRRIAHGLLILSIASGLFTQSEMNTSIKANLIALLELKWKFFKPVFIGDTVYVETEITDKKETKKKDLGILVNKRTVVNQHAEAVQEGEFILMIRRKP